MNTTSSPTRPNHKSMKLAGFCGGASLVVLSFVAVLVRQPEPTPPSMFAPMTPTADVAGAGAAPTPTAPTPTALAPVAAEVSVTSVTPTPTVPAPVAKPVTAPAPKSLAKSLKPAPAPMKAAGQRRKTLRAQIAQRGILGIAGTAAAARVFADEATIEPSVDLAVHTASLTPTVRVIERVPARITRGVRIGNPRVGLVLAARMAEDALDDEASVRAIMAERRAAMQWCFERALKGEATAGGELELAAEVTIGATGRVTSARVVRSTGAIGHADVDRCVLSLFKRTVFAPPADGHLTVSMSLDFSAPGLASTGLALGAE